MIMVNGSMETSGGREFFCPEGSTVTLEIDLSKLRARFRNCTANQEWLLVLPAVFRREKVFAFAALMGGDKVEVHLDRPV